MIKIAMKTIMVIIVRRVTRKIRTIIWIIKKSSSKNKSKNKGKKINDKNVKDYDDIENNKNNTYEKNDWNNKHKHKHKHKNNNKYNDSFSVIQLILFYCPH